MLQPRVNGDVRLSKENDPCAPCIFIKRMQTRFQARGAAAPGGPVKGIRDVLDICQTGSSIKLTDQVPSSFVMPYDPESGSGVAPLGTSAGVERLSSTTAGSSERMATVSPGSYVTRLFV